MVNRSRRTLLRTLGAVGAGSLTGCSGSPEERRSETPPPTTPSPSVTNPPETPTDTNTPTRPETGRIRFEPEGASGDEDWLANPIFSDDQFNGDITYEVNIDDALEHRSIVEDQDGEFNEVDEFVNNFWEEEWRKGFREEYSNSDLTVSAPPEIDTEILNDDNRPADERIVESGLHEFILDYEDYHNNWEVTSTYRDAIAAMLQEVIDPDREDVIVSPHEVADLEGGYHGMDWLLQNFAGHRDNYGSEEEYRQAKQEVLSFLGDTPYPHSEEHDERVEEIQDSDYTEEGTWEYNRFAHFALYDGESVERGEVRASAEQMKNRVQQAFLNFNMNHNYDRGFEDIDMDEDFAKELAKYAMNPAEAELTGQFIKEYSAVVRDMDESGRFEGQTLELGMDYAEVN